MKIFIIILAALIVMAIETYAQTPLTIQTAAITVDGDTADWNGIIVAATDPQGDDSPLYTGDDIKAIYLAKDAVNLYIRLDLYDNANPNFGNGPSPYEGSYRFQIYSNSSTYSFLELGLANYYCEHQWTMGCNGANSNAPPSFQGTNFAGVFNNVVEIKVTLADIANPTVFYQVSSVVNNCCVPNDATLDSCAVYTPTTFVRELAVEMPTQFALGQNYPNPFNPISTIEFSLLHQSRVTLLVYDLLGREVDMLVNQEFNSGVFKTTWDGTKSASGLYYYRLIAVPLDGSQSFIQTRKMILTK